MSLPGGRGPGTGLLGAALLASALAPLPVRGAPARRTFPVVDLHVDLSYQVNYKGRTLERGVGQFQARHLLRSGVAGVVLPLYVPRSVAPEGPRVEDLALSRERILSLLPATKPYAAPGCAAEPGQVRTWFAFEGSGQFAAEPEKVGEWVARGVRVFGAVHTFHNGLASSSAEPDPGHGLTEAGQRWARAVLAAGGVLDVSHASDRATDELIELSRAAGRPVVATHSNARALADHPRNLTDAQLQAIAATGGVVGVNFHSPFVRRGGTARLTDVVRQVRHLVRVAGVDHVALGSDFEGGIRPARGLEDARAFPRLARALLAAGLGEAEVAKVFGENALRVLCPPG